MGILKGFTNLFIGEDDSDGIDFSQDFGSPNGGKGSAAKDSFLMISTVTVQKQAVVQRIRK